MEALTLKNAWKRRDEVIQRCRNAGACREEFKKLVRAKNERKFIDVLFYNFYWCTSRNRVFDYDIKWGISNSNEIAFVRLNEPLEGHYCWIVDRYGDYVMSEYEWLHLPYTQRMRLKSLKYHNFSKTEK